MKKFRKVQKDTKLWTNIMSKVRRAHPTWGYDRRKKLAYSIRNNQ